MWRRNSEKGLDRRAVRTDLLACLRDLGLRLVELVEFLAQPVELLPPAEERVLLASDVLAELLDVLELLLESAERLLTALELLGPAIEGGELLGELVCLLRDRGDGLILSVEPVDAFFEPRDRVLERLHTLTE